MEALFLWLLLSMCVGRVNAGGKLSCSDSDIPVIRPLEDLYEDSYGIPGLSHITLAGATHTGLKEVEVWFQTFTPGAGTPIHRHSCEEVFLTLKGKGTLYMEATSGKKVPGEPNAFAILPNTTFTIPVNQVHQVKNTDQVDDLQIVVVISRPPIKVFIYNDWHTPHTAAVLHFPFGWDDICMKKEASESKDEL